jgi:hypothetical protein
MRYAPWHAALIAEVFRAGPSVALPVIAKRLGQSEKACERVLRSAWGQEQLGLYDAAVRSKLVAERVAPLEELAKAGHAAAKGLVDALSLATERENVREMRECSVAILAHLGMGPVKRTEKTVTHGIARINDPVMLQRIIDGEEIDPALLEGPDTKH